MGKQFFFSMDRQKDRDIIHLYLVCSGYLQIVRALLMSGMAVGVLAFILSLVGMECTYIGGKDKEKTDPCSQEASVT